MNLSTRTRSYGSIRARGINEPSHLMIREAVLKLSLKRLRDLAQVHAEVLDYRTVVVRHAGRSAGSQGDIQ